MFFRRRQPLSAFRTNRNEIVARKTGDDNDNDTNNERVIIRRKKILAAFRIRHLSEARDSRIYLVALFLFLSIVGGAIMVMKYVVDFYYTKEKSMEDHFLAAKLYMPLRYLQVRYFQRKPNGEETHFIMNANNSFVINLDGDTKRLRAFRTNNRHSDGTEFRFRRFPGTVFEASSSLGEDVALKGTTTTTTRTAELRNRSSSVEHENRYFVLSQYPFLRHLARNKRYGDVGVAISHLNILTTLARSGENTHLDYMFVFEDDVKIDSYLLRNKVVTAPADADFVFLMDTSTKTVTIPFRNSSYYAAQDHAVRVIQGYGFYGYIVTKNGAATILDQLRWNRKDPIDTATFDMANLRVYHPTRNWPLVYHVRGISSKSSQNNNR